jgi:hypothetical protein
MHDDRRRSDRGFAVAVWTAAVLCVAVAWRNASATIGWPGLTTFLALVALYLIVWGWNLWHRARSREGDSMLVRVGRNLPWLWWLSR